MHSDVPASGIALVNVVLLSTINIDFRDSDESLLHPCMAMEMVRHATDNTKNVTLRDHWRVRIKFFIIYWD